MSTTTVTDAQAQAVLDAVIARYKVYFEPIKSEDGQRVICAPAAKPVLRRDEHGHAVISWEDGPDDWAYQATEGGSTETERVAMAQASKEFGVRLTASEPSAVAFPKTVEVEPYSSFELGVYPA